MSAVILAALILSVLATAVVTIRHQAWIDFGLITIAAGVDILPGDVLRIGRERLAVLDISVDGTILTVVPTRKSRGSAIEVRR